MEQEIARIQKEKSITVLYAGEVGKRFHQMIPVRTICLICRPDKGVFWPNHGKQMPCIINLTPYEFLCVDLRSAQRIAASPDSPLIYETLFAKPPLALRYVDWFFQSKLEIKKSDVICQYANLAKSRRNKIKTNVNWLALDKEVYPTADYVDAVAAAVIKTAIEQDESFFRAQIDVSKMAATCLEPAFARAVEQLLSDQQKGYVMTAKNAEIEAFLDETLGAKKPAC
jgi:hypothetical protein